MAEMQVGERAEHRHDRDRLPGAQDVPEEHSLELDGVALAMGELVLEEHLAAMRAEEPQELSIGLDQPEGSLEVFVGARAESLDDPARGPENPDYVARLGLPHLLVTPGVDRPRGVDLHVRRADRLESFAGVLRPRTAGSLLRTEKPVKLLLQLLRV